MTEFTIAPADLTAPAFAALVARHVDHCDRTAPPESCHRLEVADLDAPGITVWQAAQGDTVLGMCALKALSETKGEVKSMHTAVEARGRGIAAALLDTLIKDAQRRGYRSLWLETGVHPDFAAARRLYDAYGFRETAPFGSYVPDVHSVFMTRDLTTAEDLS